MTKDDICEDCWHNSNCSPEYKHKKRCEKFKKKNDSPCNSSKTTKKVQSSLVVARLGDASSNLAEVEDKGPEDSTEKSVKCTSGSDDDSSLSDKIIKLTDKEGECNWISCICRDDVKSAVKKLKEENNKLKKQLIIDFKVPLSEESAKHIISGRFKMSNKRKDKIFGSFE